MPKIIYGTAWKQNLTATLVELAIETGFRGIDTACQPRHYHEAGVGEGLAAALIKGLTRQDIYLQTKYTPSDGQDPKRMPYDPAASLSRQVAQSFEVSLENLRTDYLDCLILHSPLHNERDLMEVWRAMEAVVYQGGARQIGLSNCYELGVMEYLHDRADIKPAVLQNRFYANTGYDRDLRAVCRQLGICYQSFWTLTANPQMLAHPALLSVAGHHSLTPPQTLFRYLTQIDVTPLTGTTDPAHMREDLAIFETELAPEEIDRLDALFQ
jgi:diketogulonate reductase-like aldo/keto reductase